MVGVAGGVRNSSEFGITEITKTGGGRITSASGRCFPSRGSRRFRGGLSAVRGRTSPEARECPCNRRSAAVSYQCRRIRKPASGGCGGRKICTTDTGKCTAYRWWTQKNIFLAMNNGWRLCGENLCFVGLRPRHKKKSDFSEKMLDFERIVWYDL